MKRTLSKHGALIGLLAGMGMAVELVAATVELPEFAVTQSRVVIPHTAATFTMPVSALRAEPQVDLQGRNMAEGQADVAIRGGIFEGTGFRVGAATLFDPQTGHYFAEIPVPGAMLQPPRVSTGAENALLGMNASVGTISWAWAPVRTGGFVTAGLGDHHLNFQEVHAGWLPQHPGLFSAFTQQAGIEVNVARSEGAGTRSWGDHDFERYSGRVQWRHEEAVTDFFAGYQAKDFGWVNLYTPFNSRESERLKTTLWMLNHRREYAGGSHVEATAYQRLHKDHYQFNRLAPNRAFIHETKVRGVALEGRHELEGDRLALLYTAQGLADRITSTALRTGHYTSRKYWKLSVAPEKVMEVGPDRTLHIRPGLSWDATNRDGSALSPFLSLEHRRQQGEGREERLSLDLAQATQVPGYTALKSSPTAGLFRGNTGLGREKSRSVALGFAWLRPEWSFAVHPFYRQDRNLVDWTYSSATPNARTANAVQVDVLGVELVYRRHLKDWELSLSYAALTKEEDYRNALVDASFYAGNYPTHRLNSGIVWRGLERIELRSDTEFRVQKANHLRRGESTAVLSHWKASWSPVQVSGLELWTMVDNAFNVGFESVPAVPGARRQWSAGATLRW